LVVMEWRGHGVCAAANGGGSGTRVCGDSVGILYNHDTICNVESKIEGHRWLGRLGQHHLIVFFNSIYYT
jgi:hypothetical protein